MKLSKQRCLSFCKGTKEKHSGPDSTGTEKEPSWDFRHLHHRTQCSEFHSYPLGTSAGTKPSLLAICRDPTFKQNLWEEISPKRTRFSGLEKKMGDSKPMAPSLGQSTFRRSIPKTANMWLPPYCKIPHTSLILNFPSDTKNKRSNRGNIPGIVSVLGSCTSC